MANLFQKLQYNRLLKKGRSQRSTIVEPSEAKLVICCVFKNEAEYLKEWIEFHLQQGFEKIYLIDNRSTDGYEKVLEPFVLKMQVEVSSTENSSMDTFIQAKEYNRVLPIIKKEQGEHCWVAFIDVDEFLFSVTNQPIREVLNGFMGKSVAGVLANWFMFGTSGLKRLDSKKTMVEQLTRRAPDEHDEHRISKPLVYLANAFKFFEGPHKPIAKGDSEYYYSDGTVFNRNKEQFIHSPLRINHYWYRSEEYYENQKKANRKVFGGVRKVDLEKWHMERCNEEKDQEILQVK